jgi:hypothetical protein
MKQRDFEVLRQMLQKVVTPIVTVPFELHEGYYLC